MCFKVENTFELNFHRKFRRTLDYGIVQYIRTMFLEHTQCVYIIAHIARRCVPNTPLLVYKNFYYEKIIIK